LRYCARCRSLYSERVAYCLDDGQLLQINPGNPLEGASIDRYTIRELIGEGSMGCVFRASHTVLIRDYAVKVLYRDFATDATLLERFKREALVLGTIAHANIVRVEDFVSSPQYQMIVMELLPGRTLEKAIAAEAPFPPYRAGMIARQIAAGLAEAHRHGFVHRDLKPSNVMLLPGERDGVKLLDFGLVGLVNDASQKKLTATGLFLGTPAYVAPEQIDASTARPAADLYALGVILYEMLAGVQPFSGRTHAEVLAQHITKTPPPLPPSNGLEEAVAWLMEKDPEKRPREAKLVLSAIDSLRLVHDAATVKSPEDKETDEEHTDLMGAEDTVPRPRSSSLDILELDTVRPEFSDADDVRTEIVHVSALEPDATTHAAAMPQVSPLLEFDDRTTPEAPAPVITDISQPLVTVSPDTTAPARTSQKRVPTTDPTYKPQRRGSRSSGSGS
jgi:serine/threonine protein kinase